MGNQWRRMERLIYLDKCITEREREREKEGEREREREREGRERERAMKNIRHVRRLNMLPSINKVIIINIISIIIIIIITMVILHVKQNISTQVSLRRLTWVDTFCKCIKPPFTDAMVKYWHGAHPLKTPVGLNLRPQRP